MSLFRLILGTVCLALLSTLGFALAAAPDCTTQPCVYVPFALKPPSNAPEPTLTTTIQPTTTASPTNTPAEPTTTASPTNTPAGPTVTATQTRTPSPTATPTQTSTPSSTPTRTQTPSATATPTLPPPSFISCGTAPDSATAPDWPVQITNIDKVAEAVTLFNRSTIVINLAGWKMCSITGGQQHPISGSLAAGETKTFVNTGGPIWNNTSPDPGALYNPSGQLVSYRAQ